MADGGAAAAVSDLPDVSVAAFVRRLEAGDLRPISVETYARQVRRFERDAGAAAALADAAEVQAWLATQLPLAASALRAFYRFVRAAGARADDPVRGCVTRTRGPRYPAAAPVAIDPAAAAAALARAHPLTAARNLALLLLATRVAPTVAALRRLSRAALAYDAPALTLAGERRVALDADTDAALRAYAACRDREHGPFGPLFANPQGGPMTRQGLWKALRAAGAACGVAGLTTRRARLAWRQARRAAGASDCAPPAAAVSGCR